MEQHNSSNTSLIITAIWSVIFLGVIFLFLTLLNYFQVLDLGLVLPIFKQFPQYKNTASLAHPTPTPTPFQYDESKATTALTSYLKDMIKPAYLPSAITVVHKLSTYGEANDTDFTYGSQWTKQNVTFHGFYHFNPQSNTETDMDIIATPPSTDPSLEESLKKYFTNVRPLKCININSTTQACESFDTKGSTKKGIGGVRVSSTSATTINLFSCSIPSQSIHKDWKSCMEMYAKDGLQ